MRMFGNLKLELFLDQGTELGYIQGLANAAPGADIYFGL
jgi:hypothetical protein